MPAAPPGRSRSSPPCQCTACAAETDSNYELDFGDDGMSVHYPHPSNVTVVGPGGNTIRPTGGSGGSPPTTAQPLSQPPSPLSTKNRLWIFQEMTPTGSFFDYSWWFVCHEPNDYLCQDADKFLGCDKSDDPE